MCRSRKRHCIQLNPSSVTSGSTEQDRGQQQADPTLTVNKSFRYGCVQSESTTNKPASFQPGSSTKLAGRVALAPTHGQMGCAVAAGALLNRSWALCSLSRVSPMESTLSSSPSLQSISTV